MKEPVRPDFKKLKETLPAEEVRKLRREYRDKVLEHWDYHAIEPLKFRRQRAWILLARDKATGELFGYNPSGKSQFSRKYVKLFRSQFSRYDVKGATGDKCHMQPYREYNRKQSHSLEIEAARLNKKHQKYEFFVARVGSKKCPVKVDWDERHASRRDNNIEFKLR